MRLVAALAFVSVVPALCAQQVVAPHEVRRAQVVLRTQLSCLGCHELDGEGGRNAPSLSTVGARRSASYIRAMIESPRSVLPGVAMPNPVMAAPVRELIIRYLASRSTVRDGPVIAVSPVAPGSRPPNGAVLYAKWCASCHGSAGNGDGPDAKYQPVRPARHADARQMAQRPDDSLFDVISVGGLPYGRSARMPAFGTTLTPSEIRALVAQIRALCRCAGPTWSRTGAPK